MSPNGEQSGEPKSVNLDSGRALLGDVLETQNSHLGNLHKILDQSFRAAENHAAFYEKLVLFDVGTIALSLTFLGQLIARAPSGHIPRHPFLWYLCPAWFLLLLSIYFCAHRIIAVNNIITNQVRQMSNSVSGNHLNRLRSLIASLSRTVGGVSLSGDQAQQFRHLQPTDGSYQTLEDVFTGLNTALMGALNQETEDTGKFLADSIRQDKRTSILARLAFASTTIALILICIFAVQSILGL